MPSPVTALGATTAGTTVNGGTLDLGGTLGAGALNLGAEVITISGTGVGTNGALVNNGSNDQTNAVQKLALGANATVGGAKRWDVRGSGNTFNMAGFTLTKKGTNTVALVATTISNPGNIDVVEGVFGFHTTVSPCPVQQPTPSPSAAALPLTSTPIPAARYGR